MCDNVMMVLDLFMTGTVKKFRCLYVGTAVSGREHLISFSNISEQCYFIFASKLLLIFYLIFFFKYGEPMAKIKASFTMFGGFK